MKQRDHLACFASRSEQSKGRVTAEAESRTRSAFQRDRDRIIHSTAFRRLQYKTQVFVYHEGDHYRTRLTHSLEVAQIARSLARYFALDDDLAEAVALGHDLGHPPFGHAGEDALRAAMETYGGFDHNVQTFRVLTELEARYPDFDGLNLTWETLEGTLKHNGPLEGPHCARGDVAVHPDVAAFVAGFDLHLHTFPALEAQLAATADDIAYNNHDIDDGVRAGAFTLEELAELPEIGNALANIDKQWPDIDTSRRIHELVRSLIGIMVDDLIATTSARLNELAPASVEDIRNAPQMTVGFSPDMQAFNAMLKEFLTKRLYRHWRVNRMRGKAKRVVSELFALYIAEPSCLPPEWAAGTDGAASMTTARRAADFIAGMTDRYALEEYDRLFNMSAKA